MYLNAVRDPKVQMSNSLISDVKKIVALKMSAE
ncbi:MAG: hypothetical protein JWQ66_3706 [Mucilaginibacter sp.]|nr:hypothetical protein [Mucilaginibacter sp.]